MKKEKKNLSLEEKGEATKKNMSDITNAVSGNDILCLFID